MLRATTACIFSSLSDSEPQNIGKNTVFPDFSIFFAHLGRLSADSFSSDSFSSLAVPTSAASSVHLINFLRLLT